MRCVGLSLRAPAGEDRKTLTRAATALSPTARHERSDVSIR